MKKDEKISAMAERLRSFHAADSVEGIGERMQRWIEDPLKPQTTEGRSRANPILVLLVSLAVMAMGTFLFFSLVQP